MSKFLSRHPGLTERSSQPISKDRVSSLNWTSTWLEAVIRVVCVAFEKLGDRRSPRNWSQCGQFVSHNESLEAFAEQYRLTNTGLLDVSTWAAAYLDVCELYRKAAN